MKKTVFTSLSFVGLIALVTSCNPAPETFDQGMAKFNERQYASSIDYFRLTPSDNEKWYDSSLVMINIAIDSIFKGANLSEMTALSRKFDADSIVKPFLKKQTLKFWANKMEVNPLLTFNMFDSLRFVLKSTEGVDTMMRKNEDYFFAGIWKCPKGTLKGNEIYFERDKESKLINGKSNKSTNGWSLGKTIYKDIYYIGNNELDHRVRVFSTDYWGYTTEYFTKTKGKMTIRSNDTLIIDYEGSVSSNNRVYFIREQRKDK